MLIIKAFVNNEQIDEIHIQNQGGNLEGLCSYRVVKPEVTGLIKHNRPDGWVPLTAMVLTELANLDYKTDATKR